MRQSVIGSHTRVICGKVEVKPEGNGGGRGICQAERNTCVKAESKFCCRLESMNDGKEGYIQLPMDIGTLFHQAGLATVEQPPECISEHGVVLVSEQEGHSDSLKQMSIVDLLNKHGVSLRTIIHAQATYLRRFLRKTRDHRTWR